MKSSVTIWLAAKFLMLALIFNFGIASAGPPSLDELWKNYAAYKTWKQRNNSDIPFFLETTKLESTLVARIGFEAAGHSLVELATILGEPAAWCGFMPLHLNVKACVSVVNGSDQEITLYFGRKHYQPPKKAKPLTPQPDCVQPRTGVGAIRWERGSANRYDASDFAGGGAAVQEPITRTMR